jgi:hypothetical protein
LKVAATRLSYPGVRLHFLNIIAMERCDNNNSCTCYFL